MAGKTKTALPKFTHEHTHNTHSLGIQVQPLLSCPWSAIESYEEGEEGNTHTQSANKWWGGSGGRAWVLRDLFSWHLHSLPPSPASYIYGCCQKETTNVMATYPPPHRLENAPSFWTSRSV